MRIAFLASLLSCVLILGSCATAPSSPSATADTDPSVSASPSGSKPLSRTEEMRKLLETGKAALDSNHLTEGIRSFVAVLALVGENESPETARLGSQAEAELVRIGTRLSLESGEAWIGTDGSQITGSSRSAGKEGTLQPAVFLYENWGSGKSPVADAPIRFEFIRGGGTLTAVVATDAYGRANAILTGLDSPSKEAVIRAYPAFTVRGFTYAFRTVQREFSYLPPSNMTKVVALERGPEGSAPNPQVLDSVASILKATGLATSPLDGKLLGRDFDKAFGGDVEALRSLSTATKASYFAFVVSEAGAPRQVEYGGKKFNIFSCECKTTLRIIRDDGTIVFALPLNNIKGQGGTPQVAVADSFEKAREALSVELNKRLEEIRAAISRP